MFGIGKLKKEVNELKKSVQRLEWLRDNPCPYTIGKPLKGCKKDLVVSEIFIHEDQFYSNWFFKWEYKTITLPK